MKSVEPQRVLVFGATGGTGRAVVDQALEAGHQVTAFARRAATSSRSSERLRVVQGDVTTLDPAAPFVAGHDAVVCALGAPGRSQARVRAVGTGRIVSAMQRAAVRRLFVVSSYGVGDSRARLPFVMRRIVVPLFLGPAFEDHEEQEAVVRGSGLDFTLVRPVGLTNGPRTGTYLVDFPAKGPPRPKGRIARADVADFILRHLSDDAWIGRTVTLSY